MTESMKLRYMITKSTNIQYHNSMFFTKSNIFYKFVSDLVNLAQTKVTIENGSFGNLKKGNTIDHQF